MIDTHYQKVSQVMDIRAKAEQWICTAILPHSFFSFQLTNLHSWIRILIRILNADPDPGGKMNADLDPDPQPCFHISPIVISVAELVEAGTFWSEPV